MSQVQYLSSQIKTQLYMSHEYVADHDTIFATK